MGKDITLPIDHHLLFRVIHPHLLDLSFGRANVLPIRRFLKDLYSIRTHENMFKLRKLQISNNNESVVLSDTSLRRSSLVRPHLTLVKSLDEVD